MAKQNKLLEEQKLMPQTNLAYEELLEDAKTIIPEYALETSMLVLQEGIASFEDASNNIWKIARDMPLLAAFLEWIKENPSNHLVYKYAKILMQNGLIKFTGAKNKPVKLRDLELSDIIQQIEEIRCQRKYSIADREQLVETFLGFLRWLKINTNNFIPEIEDPDRQKTEDRMLDHAIFASLLDLLDDRCCIIAKLLYFGGRRTLDEVVRLNVEDIDFLNHQIKMQSELIQYPRHVLEDLKFLIENRSVGPVFLGRNNTSINPSTMFRKFQEISPILGIHELSPKSLTSNK